uniref:GP-PDE domain-containing protein n=1 Tax=viral metagenome TaxID=1070528 RepID=A0A6C0AUL0_9ZZZZ
MESFCQAVHHRFDMIEMDIQLCKTGEIVIFHDTYLNGKAIIDYELAELNSFGINTLADFFLDISPNLIKIFLDVKGSPDVAYPLIDMLSALFQNQQLRNIYISGFDRHSIETIRNTRLPISLGLTTSNNFTIEQLDFLTKDLDFVCLHWTALNHENIEFLKSKNMTVFSYTCDDDYIYNVMKQYPLDGIVTDYPIR